MGNRSGSREQGTGNGSGSRDPDVKTEKRIRLAGDGIRPQSHAAGTALTLSSYHLWQGKATGIFSQGQHIHGQGMPPIDL